MSINHGSATPLGAFLAVIGEHNQSVHARMLDLVREAVAIGEVNDVDGATLRALDDAESALKHATFGGSEGRTEDPRQDAMPGDADAAF